MGQLTDEHWQQAAAKAMQTINQAIQTGRLPLALHLTTDMTSGDVLLVLGYCDYKYGVMVEQEPSWIRAYFPRVEAALVAAAGAIEEHTGGSNGVS